jgi:uncharacterized repeat protein (TIGR01451 family)
VNATVYRAADCYLQGSDDGLGMLGSGNAPTCKAEPGSTDPNRIEQWYPLTPGSNYIVDGYDEVWTAVGSMQPFPNTVLTDDGGDPYDNGAGLSWSKSIAAGGTATVAHLTVFSPEGISPVVVTKAVTPSTVAPGGTVQYSITLNNASPNAVPISTITDHLPDGFGYVSGSTSGVTTDDPTVVGQDLTWSGSYSVPAGTPEAPGTVTLTFSATASTTVGTYTNSASAVGSQGATVIPATDTAPVTVRVESSTTQPPATTVAPTTQPPATTVVVDVGPSAAPPARPVTAVPAYTG